MDWEERVSINREILGGKPVIRGTRVPVRVLLGALAGGDSIQEVCDSYRVAPEDVRAALAYAADAVDYAVVYLVPGR